MRPVYWGLVKSQIQNGKKVDDSSQLRCWEATVIPHTKELDISAIAVGHFFYLLLTKQGEVYSFGTGANGRLGIGSSIDMDVPTRLKFTSKIVSITAGYCHGCAIDEAGKCFIWGNWSGSKNMECLEPIQVPFTTKIIKVSCGQNFSAFIDENLDLYLLGSNRYGKCGLSSKHATTIETPLKITVSKFKDVSLGADFCVAISNAGELYAWGNNQYKQCGVDKKQTECTITKIVTNNQKFIQVSCSKGIAHCHAGAVSESKEVFMWGDNYKHKLGMEIENDCIANPTKINALNGVNIQKVECGGIHTYFLSEDSSIYCCGCGSDGRLGFPEAKQYRYLFREKQPRLQIKANVKDICSAYYNNIALLIS